MRIRNILYGYCYKDGRITIHESDSEIVKGVCKDYLNGKSLSAIANELNERQVEYMPGVVGWNKARIMRMLEDKRYVGDDNYPAIIDQETYGRIQGLKQSKNSTHSNVDRQADVFQISLPVRCPKCNGIMKRRVDSRREIPMRWDCENNQCKTVVGITDEALLSAITEVLNTAIANPEIINIPTEKENEPSLERRRLNSEITKAFDSIQIDKDAVRRMMIQHASLKYTELDSEVSKARRLKDIFTESQPLTTFSIEFLHRTADELMLYTDGTIGLILENGQEIRKGATYADTRC